MSKGTIGTLLGAGIGFLIGGPAGAQIGALIGGAVGSSFDTIEGRKVGEMASPRAQEGEPIPLTFGSARVTGRLMSCGEPNIVTKTEGGKGGPKVENETAYLSYSILICESSELRDSSIAGILMVIENNKIVYDVRPNPAISASDSAKWKANKVFYFGGESQGVDSTEQLIHGASNVPAYRGIARMVVTEEDVTQHGGSIPTYEFVTTQCGVEEQVTEEWRWLGTGVIGAGTRASIRPMKSDMVWAGSADSEVTSTNTTQSEAVVRFGDHMVALVSNNTCRIAPIDDVTTWSDGPTGLNLGGAFSLGHASVINGRLWVACGTAGLGYIDSVTDTSFTYNTAMLSAFGSTFYQNVAAIAGNGSNLLAMNGYGRFAKSSDGGASWSAGADIFGTGNRFYMSYGAMDSNGDRIVVAGGETGLRAAYTDDNGATFTDCTLLASSGEVGNQVKYCGGGRWLIACTGATTTSDGLYKSVDNGVTFTAVTLPTALDFFIQSKQNIAVDSTTGRVVIAGRASGVWHYYYSDDLTTWTEISRTGTEVTGIADVYPPSGGSWYIPPSGGIELPDIEGHYYDPATRGPSGPSATVDECPPVTLDEIIDKLDARAGIPTANSITTELNGIEVPGYAIDQFMTVAEAKEPLRQVYFFDCPEYDDAIRYRLRGQATDFTVDPDDLIVGEDATENGVRGQTVEFPKRLHVQYVDPATGYKPMKQTAERISPDIRVKGEMVAGANITLEADTAKQAADIGLKTAWTEREDSREIVLPMDYFADAIAAFTYSLDGRRYRITDMRVEAGAIYIESKYDRISAYSSTASGNAGPSPTGGSSLSGPTIAAVMNLPVLDDAHDKPGVYVAAGGALESWRGARIDLSRDSGTTYTTKIIPDITQGAIIGELTAILPTATQYTLDKESHLSVQLTTYGSTLDSITLAQLLNEGNPAAIMKADGTAEIIQFQTATETSPDNYELTTLVRGALNTAPAAHAIGAKFVLLNSAIRFVPLAPTDLGRVITIRPVSLGTAAANNPAYSVTLSTMESQREWQPYNVEVESDGASGYCISWVGRARLGNDAFPIHSQYFDGYSVRLTDGTVIHDIETDEQSVCVTAAEMTAIFGGGYGQPDASVVAKSTSSEQAFNPAAPTGWVAISGTWTEDPAGTYNLLADGANVGRMYYDALYAFTTGTFEASVDAFGPVLAGFAGLTVEFLDASGTAFLSENAASGETLTVTAAELAPFGTVANARVYLRAASGSPFPSTVTFSSLTVTVTP